MNCSPVPFPKFSIWPWNTHFALRHFSGRFNCKYYPLVPHRIAVPSRVGLSLRDFSRYCEKNSHTEFRYQSEDGDVFFYFIFDPDYEQAVHTDSLDDFFEFHRSTILNYLTIEGNFDPADSKNSIVVCCNENIAIGLRDCFEEGVDSVLPNYFSPQKEEDATVLVIYLGDEKNLYQEIIFEEPTEAEFIILS